ncbi:YlbF family regulator [Melissococcus plutonius]|uniref:YMCA protein n=1 Tax=Melissococcus plutonius TaxID=33970 RepID=A0A2Z5Y4F3_9ENTE|nr:YlbF family regulator [Melissococcus plutonius]BAL62786.1 YMCA protein [Melissococcus plutonius DAT561]MCV2499454.1 YlbF family regulator [Melissococcus plutonius]MCV2501214.1 YlbF family regulator [Melissococcus plutonius]MCV2505704.1 YlbF family regulator [Melissococcus plutonius]MCV2508061.1 YlbF family regulator [Melissococcus plutonius]
MENFEIDESIQIELNQLLSLIEENDIIQRYKRLEKKVQANKKLAELTEKIKTAQKEAVQFAHYDKPNAEQEAICQADRLTKEFNEQPLVIAYRQALSEANELLQYIIEMIQSQINEEIEKEGL